MSRKSDFDKQLEKRIYNLSTRKEKIYSKVGDIDSDKVKSDFGQEALGIMRDIMDNATLSNEDELSEKITRIKQLKTFIKDANLGKREQKELLTLAEKIHKALAKDADLKRKLFIKSAAALGGLLERSKGVASIMFDDELVDDLLEKTSMAGKFMADKVREKIRKHQEKKAIMKQDAQAMLNKTKTAPRAKPPRPDAPVRAPGGAPGLSPMVFHEPSPYGSGALALNGSSSQLLETLSQDVKQILNILRTSNDEKEEARLDALEEKIEKKQQKEDIEEKRQKKERDKKEKAENSLASRLSGLLAPLASIAGGFMSFAGSIPGAAMLGIAGAGAGARYGSNLINGERAKGANIDQARTIAKTSGFDVIDGKKSMTRTALSSLSPAGALVDYFTPLDQSEAASNLTRQVNSAQEKFNQSLSNINATSASSLAQEATRIKNGRMSANWLDAVGKTDFGQNENKTNAMILKASIDAGKELVENNNKIIEALEKGGKTDQESLKVLTRLQEETHKVKEEITKQTEEMKKEDAKGKSLLERIQEYFANQKIYDTDVRVLSSYGPRAQADVAEVGGGDTPPNATMMSSYSSTSGSAFSNMLSSYGASSSNMTMGPKNPKSGLKIKPAGYNGPNADGFAYPGVYAFAQMLQARVPGNEFKYFSAFNDAWHRRNRSSNNTHVRGLAFDAKFNTYPQLLKGIRLAEQMVRETGAKAIVQQHKDAEGPGYHLHFQFNSPEDAKRFYKSFYGIGGYESSINQEISTESSDRMMPKSIQSLGGQSSLSARKSIPLSTESMKMAGFGTNLKSDSYTMPAFAVEATRRSIDPNINRARRSSFMQNLGNAPSANSSPTPSMSRLSTSPNSTNKGISYSKPGTLFGALVSD